MQPTMRSCVKAAYRVAASFSRQAISHHVSKKKTDSDRPKFIYHVYISLYYVNKQKAFSKNRKVRTNWEGIHAVDL